MAPNLAPSQHDLIRAMILNKKLKVREIASVAGVVSVRSKPYAQTFMKLLQMMAEGLGLLRLPFLKFYVNTSSRSLSYIRKRWP